MWCYALKHFGVATVWLLQQLHTASAGLLYKADLFLCPDKMHPHRQTSFHNGSAILPRL